MALDTTIFSDDFAVAVDDLSASAQFSDFTVDVILQKVDLKESPLMEGIENNSTAIAYVSLEDLGSNEIEIGDKATIAGESFRVLAIDPHPHGQVYKLQLTDENS